MEPGGEAAGVIAIERIAILRKNKRGKTGIGIEIVEIFFFFVEIKRIAKGKNKSNVLLFETRKNKRAAQ